MVAGLVRLGFPSLPFHRASPSHLWALHTFVMAASFLYQNIIIIIIRSYILSLNSYEDEKSQVVFFFLLTLK